MRRGDGPKSISQGDRGYPALLVRRLGADAPGSIAVAGSSVPLTVAMTAFLCSVEAPGAAILKTLDQAVAWREAGRCIVSGFHSPLEQQCLDILLRGKQPIVMALPRGLGTLRLPTAQRKALDEGRLTIISSFPTTERRATVDLARRRNRLVAALAEEVVFAFVSGGGSLSLLHDELSVWGVEAQVLYREARAP